MLPIFGGRPVGLPSSASPGVASVAAVGVAVAGVAEEFEVGEVGAAAVEPFEEVMGLAAVDGGAAAVADAGGDDQGTPLGFGGEPLPTSLAEGVSGAVEEVSDNAG